MRARRHLRVLRRRAGGCARGLASGNGVRLWAQRQGQGQPMRRGPTPRLEGSYFGDVDVDLEQSQQPQESEEAQEAQQGEMRVVRSLWGESCHHLHWQGRRHVDPEPSREILRHDPSARNDPLIVERVRGVEVEAHVHGEEQRDEDLEVPHESDRLRVEADAERHHHGRVKDEEQDEEIPRLLPARLGIDHAALPHLLPLALIYVLVVLQLIVLVVA